MLLAVDENQDKTHWHGRWQPGRQVPHTHGIVGCFTSSAAARLAPGPSFAPGCLWCLCLALAPKAEKLDQMLKERGKKIDAVLNFDVPDSLLVSSGLLRRGYVQRRLRPRSSYLVSP